MQRELADARRFPRTRDVLIRVGSLVLLLAAAALIGYKLGLFNYRHAMEHIQRLRQTHSLVGFSIGFVLVFAICTAIGVPGAAFMVLGGALFGTSLGSVLSWFGAMIGATIGYWIARTVGRDMVTRWLKRFKRVDAAIADTRHFGGIVRLRLIPVVPLGVVSFTAGLANAPFGAYLAATAVGVIPAIAIYSYFADSVLEGVGSGRSDALLSLIVSSVLLIALSLLPKLIGRNRKEDRAPVT